MKILLVTVPGLKKENAQAFEDAVLGVDGVKKVETWPGRAEISLRYAKDAAPALAALRAAGFDVTVREPAGSDLMHEVRIDGMTCRACEITIERRFKKIAGVKKVEVNAAKGIARIVTDGEGLAMDELRSAVEQDGYKVRDASGKSSGTDRPSLLRLVGLFGAVLILGGLLSKVGLSSAYDTSSAIGFVSALLIGLVAGSSSCMAVSGGLLLSASATFRRAYGNASTSGRMKPVFLFVAGRVSSYGILGGLVGIIGSALTPSPLATGIITLAAAAFMFIMGLDMLGIAPRWLLGLLPRMPKFFGHRIMDAGARSGRMMPFLLGAATFFIPCGFTQSFQIYALSSGSFTAGAAALAGFALGTSPALLALGWASSALKGRPGKLFFQFSGAIVVVLGLWNVQNGLTVAGHPLTLPSLRPAPIRAVAAEPASDTNVVMEGSTQVIRMKIGADPFYLPSDEFTVRAGTRVRMEISGVGTGCRSIFQIPKFKVSIALSQPLNIVEFTPDKSGDAVFSCSMGMFRGTLHVIKS